jgi:hypothetical protein
MTSAFKRGSEGINLLYFSARYRTIEALSNKQIGFPSGPSLSTAHGILEFGLTETKPEVNCSPLEILITIIVIKI